MGTFTNEMSLRREQKRLFDETDKNLREKILDVGEREIIPRLHKKYKDSLFKDVGIHLENGYRLHLNENKRSGELELEIDTLVENIRLYGSINTTLSKFYEEIREEYGVNISFYMPDFEFF